MSATSAMSLSTSSTLALLRPNAIRQLHQHQSRNFMRVKTIGVICARRPSPQRLSSVNSYSSVHSSSPPTQQHPASLLRTSATTKTPKTASPTSPRPHFTSRPYVRQFSSSTASHRESSGDALSPYLESNAKWAEKLQKEDPQLLETLSKGQKPKVLWLGCSDSRVPETTLLGLKPGDVFVHRNIANVVIPTDLSSLSVIEFSVVYLKVQHIIVCGHSSCGGVAASLGNSRLGKIDTWLMPLRKLRMQLAKQLEGLSDAEKSKILVEANVKSGVETVRSNPDVIDAIKDRGLTVHGCVYDLATGKLNRVETDDKDAGAIQEAFRCG